MSNDIKKVPVFINDDFRPLEWKDMKVEKVFPAYRFGWVTKIGKDGKPEMKPGAKPGDKPKQVPREYHYFPIDERETVGMRDESIMARKDEDKKELREKVWDDAFGGYCFKRVTAKLDGTWFKTFKKVFDVRLTLAEPMKFNIWDKNKKAEVETVTNYVQARLSAGKVKKMVSALTKALKDIKLIPGKDKLGAPAMVMPFDWEDAVATQLEGKFFTFSCEGTGMNSVYTFQATAPFTTQAEAEEVFGEEPAKEQKPRYGEPTKKDIEDCPFI